MSIGTLPQSFRGYIGIAKESSFGDGVSPEYYVDATSDGFSLDNEVDFDEDTTRSRGAHKGEAGPLSDEGSVDFPANPENGLGLLLLAAFGDEDFDEPDEGVGEHVFTPSDTLPSLAVEVGRDIDVVRHTGVGIDSLELSHAAEDALTASTDAIAKEPDPSVAESDPTYSDLRNFRFHDADTEFAGVDRTPDLQEVTPGIENDLEALYRGERTAGKMSVGERTVSVSATLDFEDESLFEYFLGEAGATEAQSSLEATDLTLTWTSPETIGDSDTQYKLVWEMPRAIVLTHEANIDGNDLVAEDVELRGLVDPSEGYEAKATLTNGITQAY